MSTITYNNKHLFLLYTSLNNSTHYNIYNHFTLIYSTRNYKSKWQAKINEIQYQCTKMQLFKFPFANYLFIYGSSSRSSTYYDTSNTSTTITISRTTTRSNIMSASTCRVYDFLRDTNEQLQLKVRPYH